MRHLATCTLPSHLVHSGSGDLKVILSLFYILLYVIPISRWYYLI